MSRAWEHYEDIPKSTKVRSRDGSVEVAPLREPRDGELVVRVLAAPTVLESDVQGAVVEVVAVQEKDELVLGDRLWIFDRAPCGHCELCRRDHESACPDLRKVMVEHPDSDFLVLPPWIARRGRVRLPAALSDLAAAELGRNAGILRALRMRAPSNPLRILVVDDGSNRFLGPFLETLWPDARRVLLGNGPINGYHGRGQDPRSLLALLEHPADLVICLADFDGGKLGSVVSPGGTIVLVSGSCAVRPQDLWSREMAIASTCGAVPDDLERFRKQFVAFGSRWDGLVSSGALTGIEESTGIPRMPTTQEG